MGSNNHSYGYGVAETSDYFIEIGMYEIMKLELVSNNSLTE